jgi:2-oxoacid:acceptor oxidoreductase delta subunit (pyruvate/2-ketoisovalerate family)
MKTENEIKPKLEAQPAAELQFWRAVRPIVDQKIPADKSCAQFCPHGAITWTPDNKIKIDYSRCDGCLICLRECHSGAIKEERE